MSSLSPAERALLQLMRVAPRGPRRDGCFALWLVVRVAEDLLLDPPLPERPARRRVELLGRRLSSLTLPPPLRRGITTAVRALEGADAADASRILANLAPAAREALGAEAADAVTRAARAARPPLS